MIDRKYDQSTTQQIKIYLSFLVARAKGQLKMCARLIRDFVMTHPEYKHDSNVSNKVCYDLIKEIENYTSVFDFLVKANYEELLADPNKIVSLVPQDLSLYTTLANI
jgi:Glutamate-cysteine ligase